jgi:L-threonylcarbamoyladenylate synthase
MILSLADPTALPRAVQTLAEGGLVGIPTETVYGLGADACNDAAVARIFAAKGRPADHPLIVHVADLDGGASGVAHFAQQVPDFAQALMAAFWPGALTLILPRRPGVAAAAAGGQDSVGLRCPSHPGAQALLRALRQRPDGAPWSAATPDGLDRGAATPEGLDWGAATPEGVDWGAIWGVAAPSANRFGRVSPTTAAHVQSELGDGLLVLDGGPCSLGIESTIVDCTRGVPVLLRPGSISAQALAQVCGQPVRSAADLAPAPATDSVAGLDAFGSKGHLPAAPRASGTLESHYAPRAKVRLFDAQALQAALQAWRTASGQPEAAADAVPVAAVLESAGSSASAEAAATSTAPLSVLAGTSAQLGVYARSVEPEAAPGLVVQHMPDTAAQTAHELFAVLRALDDAGVQEIWVERVPATPDWAGVADRLQRASA